MKRIFLTAVLFFVISGSVLIEFDLANASSSNLQTKRISIRTENYPRPPYSGATYYIYERDGGVICTKLEVCNKYNYCSTTYEKGAFKEDVDIETGEPYGKTDPVFIPTKKLKKHVCLTKFKLL
jgi:hypothetical protein